MNGAPFFGSCLSKESQGFAFSIWKCLQMLSFGDSASLHPASMAGLKNTPWWNRRIHRHLIRKSKKIPFFPSDRAYVLYFCGSSMADDDGSTLRRSDPELSQSSREQSDSESVILDRSGTSCWRPRFKMASRIILTLHVEFWKSWKNRFFWGPVAWKSAQLRCIWFSRGLGMLWYALICSKKISFKKVIWP